MDPNVIRTEALRKRTRYITKLLSEKRERLRYKQNLFRHSLQLLQEAARGGSECELSHKTCCHNFVCVCGAKENVQAPGVNTESAVSDKSPGYINVRGVKLFRLSPRTWRLTILVRNDNHEESYRIQDLSVAPVSRENQNGVRRRTLRDTSLNNELIVTNTHTADGEMLMPGSSTTVATEVSLSCLPTNPIQIDVVIRYSGDYGLNPKKAPEHTCVRVSLFPFSPADAPQPNDYAVSSITEEFDTPVPTDDMSFVVLLDKSVPLEEVPSNDDISSNVVKSLAVCGLDAEVKCTTLGEFLRLFQVSIRRVFSSEADERHVSHRRFLVQDTLRYVTGGILTCVGFTSPEAAAHVLLDAAYCLRVESMHYGHSLRSDSQEFGPNVTAMSAGSSAASAIPLSQQVNENAEPSQHPSLTRGDTQAFRSSSFALKCDKGDFLVCGPGLLLQAKTEECFSELLRATCRKCDRLVSS